MPNGSFYSVGYAEHHDVVEKIMRSLNVRQQSTRYIKPWFLKTTKAMRISSYVFPETKEMDIEFYIYPTIIQIEALKDVICEQSTCDILCIDGKTRKAERKLETAIKYHTLADITLCH